MSYTKCHKMVSQTGLMLFIGCALVRGSCVSCLVDACVVPGGKHFEYHPCFQAFGSSGVH